MPDFTFTSPEGKDYTVTGPEGATKEQAFAILQQQLKAGAPPMSPAERRDKLSSMGVPIPPDAQAPPPPAPSRTEAALSGLKNFAMSGPHTLEAALRMGAGGLGGLAGGAMGGLEWAMDKLNPRAPQTGSTASSGFDAGAQGANRLIDKVIGPTSEQAGDIMNAVATAPELQALQAVNPIEGAMMGAAGRAAMGARLPSLPKVPVMNAARSAIDKARGVPAAAAAEDLRTSSLATASASAQRAREAAQRATEQAARAGLDAEHAGAWGAAAQHNLDSAAKIGDAIEQQLLAKPTMSKEELGAMMRAAGTTLRDEKIKARRAAAGYDQATAQDGAKIVPTTSAQKVIEAEKESLKNPNLRATLERVNKELQPGPNAVPAILGPDGKPLTPTAPQGLTLTQAESLRDYLNDAIAEKSGTAMSAADKSSERALLKIKDALTEEMEKTSPLWKQANENFRKASRGELDYLTGKGDLAKTLQTDSLSGQYMQTEAQVTGHIIAKANAGSPVLSMLVKQAPEIKNAARMYYTGELFGKGAMPTPGVMETFVKTNERSLKQLGLYDEFKDIASAQRARLTAIDDFKKQVSQASSAERNAGQLEKSATTEAAKHQRVADRFTQFQTEIANLPAKQLPGHIKSLGKALQDDGLITQDQYGQMIRESDAVTGGFEDAAKRKALLLKIGAIIGIGVAGNEAARRAL